MDISITDCTCAIIILEKMLIKTPNNHILFLINKIIIFLIEYERKFELYCKPILHRTELAPYKKLQNKVSNSYMIIFVIEYNPFPPHVGKVHRLLTDDC
jgi:hypothetical protein